MSRRYKIQYTRDLCQRHLELEVLESRLAFDAALSEIAAESTVHGTVASTSTDATAALFQPFASEDAWREWMLNRAVAQYETQFGVEWPYVDWNYWGGPDEDGLTFTNLAATRLGTRTIAADNAFALTASLDSNVNYSSTSTQVRGIDEADLVETDGRYLYVLRGTELVILDAQHSAGVRIVGRQSLATEANPYTSGVAMYLHGGRVSVISRGWNESGSITYITTFDVSDPSAVGVEKTSVIEGSYLQSRMVGDRLFVVTSSNMPWLPGPRMEYIPPEPVEESPEEPVAVEEGTTTDDGSISMNLRIVKSVQVVHGSYRYESRDAYVARMREWLSTQQMPRLGTLNAEGNIEFRDLLTADRVFAPFGQEHASQIITVASIDLGGPTVGQASAIGIMADQYDAMHMSSTGLYIASQNTPVFSTFRGDGSQTTPETTIFKVSIDAEGGLQSPSVAHIQGLVPDQFHLDEYNGDLRVVTTSWEGARLYVLRAEGDVLNVVGKIDNIIPNEQAFAVRYFGEIAYVVTFPSDTMDLFRSMNMQLADPLFAISLADPTNPVVLGRLEIPGFSDHLIPVDETHLIGIGRDVDPETGEDLGLQASMFDVSDWLNPRIIDRYAFQGGTTTRTPGIESGWGSSTFDPHAFSYFAEKGVFAVPVASNGGWWMEPVEGRLFEDVTDSGMQLLQIGEDFKFSEIGRVDFDSSTVNRSLRIGDAYYFVSPYELRAVNIEDPTQVVSSVDLLRAGQEWDPRNPTDYRFIDTTTGRIGFPWIIDTRFIDFVPITPPEASPEPEAIVADDSEIECLATLAQNFVVNSYTDQDSESAESLAAFDDAVIDALQAYLASEMVVGADAE